MKITDVTSAMYSRPFERPISNGKYTYTASNLVIVTVHTDEGITGVGWTDGGDIVNDTVKSLRARVVGESPFDLERCWAKMYQPKVYGRKGLTTRAISAVDIAIWDIIGKAANQPLYRLLGGYTDAIRVYIAGGYYEEGKGLRELAKEVEDNVAAGANAVKIKVGAVPIREDVERVRVCREAIGPKVDLMVDANNAYLAADAIRLARHLERYDVFWFEEPVSPDNIPACAEVARAVDVPIAAGENEYTHWGFRDLVTAGAIDVAMPDAKVLGGITPWRKVAALCDSFDIPVAPHGAQEVHVHLAAAIPNGLIVEYYNANVLGLAAEMFEEPLRIVDGCISPPQRPGLGVSLKTSELEKYRVG